MLELADDALCCLMILPAILRAACVLLLLVSGWVQAQETGLPDAPEKLDLAPPPSDRFPAKWYTRVGDGTDVVLAPVRNHPYTATVETVLLQAAGRPEQQSSGFQARDRFGRTRSEAESGGFTQGEQVVKVKTVVVVDPVSHCDFHWIQPMTNVEMPADLRVAMVTCRPQTLRYKEVDLYKRVMESPEEVSHIGGTTTNSQHLVPTKVDGVMVDRLRVSNSRVDEQGQVVSWFTETWYSPELQELVRLGDEKGGYTGLSNIQLIDPDPKLFYPPDGYRIDLQAPR